MTVAEIQRFNEGAIWRLKREAQFNYSLADLIGISVGRLLDSGVKYPELFEAYPDLFEQEVIEQKEEEIRAINSQNRFMEFAMRFNAQKRKGVEDNKL